MLDIRDIHVHYGKLKAVNGVSMSIEKGAVVSLLGANGSGKSTILKAISGLKKPVSGEIWFDGQKIDGHAPHQIVRLGVSQIPEGKGLFPFMSVFENLRMGAYSRNDKKQVKQDIEEMFELFPLLAERRNSQARLLSGGEQEMLAIARALLSRPRMLLMDEPLQGLAPLVQEQIADIILDLNIKRGLTILMVEHNVYMALEMSHLVYILEIGTVRLKGKPQDLSKTEYVQKIFLAE